MPAGWYRDFWCRLCGAYIGAGDPRYPHKHCADCKAESDARLRRLRRENPITKAVRDTVIKRDGMLCRYCGRAVRLRRDRTDIARDTMELEHVMPLIAGGRSTVENLVVACLWCNRKKAGRPLT